MYYDIVRMLRRFAKTLHWTDLIAIALLVGVVVLALWLEMGGF